MAAVKLMDLGWWDLGACGPRNGWRRTVKFMIVAVVSCRFQNVCSRIVCCRILGIRSCGPQNH